MKIGTFTIVAGPMTGSSFSYGDKTGLGKTTTAIEIAKTITAQYGHGSVVALQPIENTRDKGNLVGKNGETWPALLLDDPMKAMHAIEAEGVKLLLIDEAHLWLQKHNKLAVLMQKATGLGVSVWLFGCDTDHCNKPFPWFKLLKPWADVVHYVTGRCQCGRPATKTFRHGLSEEPICVDTKEGHYESTCMWPCFAINFVARKIRRLFRKKGAK